MNQSTERETSLIDSQEVALVNAYIQSEFINLFLQQNHRAQVGITAASVVVASMWANVGYTRVAGVWVCAMLLLCGLRYALTARWVRGAVGAKACRRVAWAMLPGALLICVPLLWFRELPAAERAAISIILLALGTASVATTAGYQRLYLSYAGPVLLFLGLAWLVVWRQERAAMAEAAVGLLVLAYLAFLFNLARDANKVFDESCRIRFKEHERNAQLEVALAAADEASHIKTQFMAAASHDLRQPLHSLNVLLTALRLRPLDLRGQEILKLLDTLSTSMNSQLEGFLDIAKLDAGRIEPHPEPVALNQLLAACHAEMMEVARAQGVELILQADTVLVALTDPVLLLRVVRNLTDNALKFTPKGTVTLSLLRSGSSARITVKDSGMGIAPENQARVFNEFFQVASSENSHSRSSSVGLGLSIVRRLCKLLGIEVSLASELGHGTEVILTLPLA